MSREEIRYCDVCTLQLTKDSWQENSQYISFSDGYYDVEIKLVKHIGTVDKQRFDICLQFLAKKVAEIGIALMEHRQKIKEGTRKK